MLARSVQHRRSIVSDAPTGFRCFRICRTISFSGSNQGPAFRAVSLFRWPSPAVQPFGVYLFVRNGIRVAVDPTWPSFRRSRHRRRLPVDCRHRRSRVRPFTRQTRQRAILERAARAQGTRALIDPKVLSVAMQAGRALGWQRLIPLALLGFLATQWVREARREDTPRSD